MADTSDKQPLKQSDDKVYVSYVYFTLRIHICYILVEGKHMLNKVKWIGTLTRFLKESVADLETRDGEVKEYGIYACP